MGKRIGISGAALKMIALLSMTMDHIGVVIVGRFMVTEGFDQVFWEGIYQPLRSIGRIAFPIFCFLLVEGFIYTKSKGKYFGRMIIFALISEIPFNLALKGTIAEPKYQNIFWELSLGILLMIIIERIEKLKENELLKWSLILAVVLLGIWLAETLNFDYGDHGMISIVLLYCFRSYRFTQLIAGIISFLWSLEATFAFLPIAFYNGKRGRQMKYVFYLFYPSHLLLFYLIIRIAGCIY